MDRETELRLLIASNLGRLTSALSVIDTIAMRFPHLSPADVVGEVRRQQQAASQQADRQRFERASTTNGIARRRGRPRRTG